MMFDFPSLLIYKYMMLQNLLPSSPPLKMVKWLKLSCHKLQNMKYYLKGTLISWHPTGNCMLKGSHVRRLTDTFIVIFHHLLLLGRITHSRSSPPFCGLIYSSPSFVAAIFSIQRWRTQMMSGSQAASDLKMTKNLAGSPH